MRINEIITEDLRKWFKEKWVRFNPQGKIMGPCARGDDSEGKPKCLPQAKAHALGKKGRASAAARKRREDPNPERRGAAKNVATKKKKKSVGEGLGKDVVKSVKVGNFRHDLVDTGFGWQVRIYNGDELYDTGLSKNSEEKGLAALDGAVAYTKKQLNIKEQGVAEEQLDELKCWPGYSRVKGVPAGAPGSCKKANEGLAEDSEPAGKLAWRIRFEKFKNLPSLIPEREGKVYLMPTDSSAFLTFRSLTGKDNSKINNMPTEAYIVSGDAMVGDMYTINFLLNAVKELKSLKGVLSPASLQDELKYVEKLKKDYVDSMVPYSQYKPGMFKMPEILADPSQIRKLDKSVTYDKNTREISIKDRADEDQAPMFTPEATCPHCGNELVHESLINEKKDACYYKVKSRYKVWPSAYASGALVKCRKKGAKNWGKSSVKEDDIEFHTGGGKGLPFPGSYEQEIKPYKTRGQERHLALTYEDDNEQIDEKWSEKYKRSIDCSNPKGFSQRAHCQGKKKHKK